MTESRHRASVATSSLRSCQTGVCQSTACFLAERILTRVILDTRCSVEEVYWELARHGTVQVAWASTCGLLSGYTLVRPS
jgi:hypothetical protein